MAFPLSLLPSSSAQFDLARKASVERRRIEHVQSKPSLRKIEEIP